MYDIKNFIETIGRNLTKSQSPGRVSVLFIGSRLFWEGTVLWLGDSSVCAGRGHRRFRSAFVAGYCAQSLQSCPALCQPVGSSLQVMGFARQESWSGLPCPPPGALPDPETEPTPPALQTDFLLLSP